MFSFARWPAFLDKQATFLKSEGFEVQFSANLELEKASLQIIGRHAAGDFTNWGTGATDYTVMSLSEQGTKPLAHRWGVIATDETFEQLFREFVELFQDHCSGPRRGKAAET